MLTIIYSSLMIIILASIFYKQIHKYNMYLYALSVIIVLFTTQESPNLINTGFIPISFFVVVLFSGLLDKGNFRKHLFMVRAELAIIGGILIFPHAFGYFEYYIESIGFFSLTFSFYLGLLAYLVMLPLFITSFQFIRRKMGYKLWKKLHRLSYVFFFLVGVHVILIQNQNMLIYALVFGFYFVFKGAIIVQERIQKQQKKSLKTQKS